MPTFARVSFCVHSLFDSAMIQVNKVEHKHKNCIYTDKWQVSEQAVQFTLTTSYLLTGSLTADKNRPLYILYFLAYGTNVL